MSTATLDASSRTFRPTMPFHMVWLATNACNARCMHCSSASASRSRDELTTDEAKDALGQLAAAGVVDLAVSGGEPLMRRDLFEVIEHGRTLGLSVGVGSNGWRLTSRDAQRLVVAGVSRFQVSLDGFADAHDRLRCWESLFDRAVATIEAAAEAGIRVHVCCTINRLNHRRLDEFTRFVATLPVQRLNFSRFVPTGRGSAFLDLPDEEWRGVMYQCSELRTRFEGRLEVVGHLAQEVLVNPCVSELPGFIGCQAGVGQGCVTANGTVFPCVLLPIPLGNLRERSFVDIWRTSPVVSSLRARAALEGACGSCAVRDRCGGCRAVAYARTGNFLAQDPRCWVPEREPSARRGGRDEA